MADRVKGTTVDVSSVIEGFKKLGAIQESLGRSIAFAMGEPVRDEALLRVPVGTLEGGSITPGLLKSSIYIAYDERQHVLNPSAYRYTISWNSKKAPHGHLIEFGHWMPYEYVRDEAGEYWTLKPLQPNPHPGPDGFWVEQHAFLGPAFDAQLPRMAAYAFRMGEMKFQELMR